ncbi:helix-turn-helix domain-containing protein [Sphingobacterium sp. LRF_L2]|uniref:helix-turn-helix domain-containing protein n=1 Tax=Sphingobacterium sp. LRF_L2 TaxID=3369421 RepID=UPI003F5DA29A
MEAILLQLTLIEGHLSVLRLQMTDPPKPLEAVDPLTYGKSSGLSLGDVAEDEELLNIDDACGFLGIARSTLSELRKTGHITDIKKGRSVRFRLSELKLVRKWYSVPKGKV